MENNKIKISLSTVLLIIAIIVIIVMAFIIFSLTENKSKSDNEIQKLKNENQSMQNKLDSIQNTLNSVTTNISNTNTVNTTNTTSTTNTNNETELANEAISKALKDKSWLIENIVSDFDKEQSQQFIDMALDSILFTKLKNDSPIYILKCDSNEGQGTSLITVEYKSGKVIANKLLSMEYSEFEIDFNKNVIVVSHDVMPYIKYYEFKDNNLVALAEGDEDAGTYKINGKTVSIDEFKKFQNNYNFEDLKIKLTNENIDKYVK